MLSSILREPKTEVRIIDRSKRPFAIIDGAVKNPIKLQFRRPAHLNEVIVGAGGFTDRASGKVIISRPSGLSCIERENSTKGQRFDIEISDILAGKPGANPIIASGDLIVVIDASPVFLIGAVQTQGRLDFRSDLSVSRAIDAAGGLMKSAVPGEVKIFRRDGGAAVISVDLAKIREEKAQDVILRPYDIIDVPFKGKPPRRLPPVIDSEAENIDRRSKLPVKMIE
jgi:protein involved in polysaccharide export with SLBB domain